MKRKFNKIITPWTVTEKVFIIAAAAFFIFAIAHSVLKFFGVIV